MKCKNCKYYLSSINYYGMSMCNISHVCYPKFCGLISDNDVKDMDICYNCEYWIGGGDWGLSCEVDYYNCSANGFDPACENFRRKKHENDI